MARNKLTLQQTTELAHLAMRFFSPQNFTYYANAIGIAPRNGQTPPFAVRDLVKYLKAQVGWTGIENSVFELQQLLEALAVRQLLVDMGTVGAPVLGKHYYSFKGLGGQVYGNLWLGPVLGAEVIVDSVHRPLVHLLGHTANGNEHGGTALAVSERQMITAKHVLEDMKLNLEQFVANAEGNGQVSVRVINASKHPRHDLAILTISDDGPPLVPVKGLVTRDPSWADPLFLMGFPPVPRALHPVMTMQGGEVAAPSVETYDGAELFLYSAVARPGNSGGPIIGVDGYLLGLVTQELFQGSAEGVAAVPPFYAGLPSAVIQEGLSDLGFESLIHAE